ncbi:carbon-nitrogen family hydrolase [Halorubellus sp. JP-L1]|uniref:carbon-nitrogen family hydrolase n=1 Tax=Halorubellus sp. JP-L1 TaxID=2715753 RepID=UPI00140ABA3F|nr:carbon-nitrogen family hydrolase [Halorubellus sp. JP-L1]NHN42670.1 carbon-nitrogen family hydrolase [Halorubellus sp. JP-L1]
MTANHVDAGDGLRVALVQFSPDAGNVEDNVERALSELEAAADAGADLVAFPELFDVGYFAFDSYARQAEGLGGPRLAAFADAARENDVWVLAGTVVEDLASTAASSVDVPTPADEGLANTAVVFSPRGDRELVYRKHHLFGYDSAEAELLVAGERRPTVDVAGFTLAVSTCYDLRFPELYREYLDAGADLVLVPSAWPYPRVEHWKTLPSTRAVENLSYVATINGAGTVGGTDLVGRSTAYDPWGTPVATTDDRETTVFADLDPERVRSVRAEFPALEDRRL